MPCGGGTLARSLAALTPAPAVVAISAQSASSLVEELVRAGVVGFVTKGRVGDGLGDLLVRCAEGEVMLCSSTAATALRSVLQSPLRVP
jgi:DNA-binding NarL/FixJ family response regulator